MVKLPEFDNFARGYAGGEDVSLVRMFGNSFDQYIYVKARWLWNYLNRSPEKNKLDTNYDLLDYGCGTGEMLKWLMLLDSRGTCTVPIYRRRCCWKRRIAGTCKRDLYGHALPKRKRILPIILLVVSLQPAFFITSCHRSEMTSYRRFGEYWLRAGPSSFSNIIR